MGKVSREYCLQTAPKMDTIVPIMGTNRADHNIPFVLFGKARQAVLLMFYTKPDDAYYLRQISRITGIGMGSLQRELKLLTEGGIISRVVRGRHILYQANQACPIFHELKAIIIKTIGVGDVLKTALASLIERIRIAFIYGSFAMGTERAGSDIDVLIVGDLTLEEVVSAFDEAQNTIGREINPVIYPVTEFTNKIINDNHFLNHALGGPVIFLIGDKSELERLAR